MISVAIQAGGRSSRMGEDKGLIALGDRPMVEHVVERVSGFGDEILITTNHPDRYAYLGLPTAGDNEPGAGALPGLRTALAAARGATVLLVACDMPFLNRHLLAHLLSLAPAADVIVPHWDDRFQTMHAVYARQPALRAVRAALDRGERRMISIYDDLNVLPVEAEQVARFDPEGKSFFNVNTPEDLLLAEALWRANRP
jgi:molybdopterin-guanine dinucleotide biosynthesis protein A